MTKRGMDKVRMFHFLLMPIPFGIAGLTWWLFYRVLSRLQSMLYPGEIILGGWREFGMGICFVPAILPALTFGFLVMNELLKLNSYVRNIAEKKGDYVPSQMFFIRAIFFFVVVIAPLVAWGFFDYYYVTEDKIVSNTLSSVKARSFAWDEVVGVETILDKAREVRLQYILRMRDGRRVDIGNCRLRQFLKGYKRIRVLLVECEDLSLKSDIRIMETDLLRRGYSWEAAKRVFRIASLRDFKDKGPG